VNTKNKQTSKRVAKGTVANCLGTGRNHFPSGQIVPKHPRGLLKGEMVSHTWSEREIWAPESRGEGPPGGGNAPRQEDGVGYGRGPLHRGGPGGPFAANKGWPHHTVVFLGREGVGTRQKGDFRGGCGPPRGAGLGRAWKVRRNSAGTKKREGEFGKIFKGRGAEDFRFPNIQINRRRAYARAFGNGSEKKKSPPRGGTIGRNFFKFKLAGRAAAAALSAGAIWGGLARPRGYFRFLRPRLGVAAGLGLEGGFQRAGGLWRGPRERSRRKESPNHAPNGLDVDAAHLFTPPWWRGDKRKTHSGQAQRWCHIT